MFFALTKLLQHENSIDRCRVGACWDQIVVMAWPPKMRFQLIVVIAWPPKMKFQLIVVMAWPPKMKIQLIVVSKHSVEKFGRAAQIGATPDL